jgi:hypothetical protein
MSNNAISIVDAVNGIIAILPIITNRNILLGVRQ